ncbi:MAG TPA: O-antigen ligase family protein, partial [Pseudomonadales bacterium]|nr:O-antigen ligase family protein [Pseudomonadales bacterium]
RALEREQRQKNRLLLLSAVVAGALVLLGLVVLFGQAMVDEVSQLGGAGAAGTARARLNSYQQAVQLIAREPWLGITLETYRSWGALADGIHNMWLKIMLNGGFVSLMAMLALLWGALRGLFSIDGKVSVEFHRDRAVIASLLFSLLLASQFYPGLSMIWWMLLGVVMSFGCLKWQYANEQRARHNERG